MSLITSDSSPTFALGLNDFCRETELGRSNVSRGIIYRRRGNVHGFDGLRLKDEGDDE
jgi:hypothetical protein